MPTLKMTEDKILTITKAGNTYEDENNAEVIKVLLPNKVNGNDLSDCVIHLCVLNQENLGDEINISAILKEHGDNLYVADINITNSITYKSGQIQLWIKVLNSDNEMVAKTNPVTYQIKEHLDIEDYIPEQSLSLLDDFSLRMENAVDAAEEAVSNPPIVGDNGNWYIWDANTGDYVDSEISVEIDLTGYVKEDDLDETLSDILKEANKYTDKAIEDLDINTEVDLTDYIKSPEVAQIGQTIVVKETDSQGKPTKWETADISGGVSKEWELVASYVHEGNRVIQPTALDVETGYFTCENHGLVTGDYVTAFYNIGSQYECPIPYELLLRASYDNNRIYPVCHSVTVVDDNTFMITGKTSYAETNNGNVDVTKFQFETQNTDFSGFENLNIDLNTYDVKIVAHDFGKRVNFTLNNKAYYRWLAMNRGHEYGLIQGIPITPLGGVEAYGSLILSLKNGVLYGEGKQFMNPIKLESSKLFCCPELVTHYYDCPVLFDGQSITTLNKLAFNRYFIKDIKPKNGGWIQVWQKKR